MSHDEPQNDPIVIDQDEERPEAISYLAEVHRQASENFAFIFDERLMKINGVIERAFISPNVLDNNLEPSNVVDALDSIAASIGQLASAVREAAKIIGPRAGSHTCADALDGQLERINDLEADEARKGPRPE